MKHLLFIGALAIAFVVLPEQEQEPQKRSVSYNIHQATINPVRGQVLFTELDANKVQVEISLINTLEEAKFPAHLHFGTVKEIGELAFALNPVDGNTGKSTTVLDSVQLSSGEIFTFDLLSQMNGSVKIHMHESFLKDRVLSYGNIGMNENYVIGGVSTCVGH